METIPIEWIEKIFAIMEDWFNTKWTDMFDHPGRKVVAMTIWQNGLAGLTHDEIRQGLKLVKGLANNNQWPPTVIEFYHYCKGIRKPHIPSNTNPFPMNKELAKSSIATIKQTLGMPYGRNTSISP